MQDALGDVTNKGARKKGGKQATKINTAGVSTSDRPKTNRHMHVAEPLRRRGFKMGHFQSV